MTLDNITPRERRYLEALADAHMESKLDSQDEQELAALLARACGRLLLGEGDRHQLFDEACKRSTRAARDLRRKRPHRDRPVEKKARRTNQ